MLEYTIVPNKGHYDVFVNGELYCTADTWPEAIMEINELKKEEKGK